MPPIISVSEARFAWPGHDPVLLIPQLEIDAGKRIFIRGPSGCGKTTLLGLLGGVLSTQSGSVEVLGHQLHQLNGSQRDHFRSDHIGYIFQMFNLLPYLSVVENVVLACRFSARRQHRALERSSNLETEALRLLDHLGIGQGSGLLDRPVASLSIGQQQRVAAARALIGSPELLIADEPTSALDTQNRERFLQLLFDECDSVGTTLLFVSHDASLEGQFDNLIDLPTINQASLQEED
ncbi:ATP-binding cassette domain-containing protein [Aestuariirhabdus sp. Z084]|uniref:ATP-binding cassette domain-containing protein n=1 Tax=Aestuariirhabdus haliotis TaxID=2918751 RepID=UPI00201B36A1|nr:ATP-binding cassette domain-containing protein [Aestuariirhabdus haliotis]MCL6416299.1 ATP-binding cassette domain-containing protein [Aestuariirhabdus haliotis]MCL6420172.1 ATP-binding cassette domain-containing protein [Aestuariirhabdus haliotis]